MTNRRVRLGNVVLKASNCSKAAAFWSEALGYEIRQVHDGTASLAPDGGRPGLNFDEGDQPHLNLVVDGTEARDAEVERLLALGARRVEWTYADGADHMVLADPDGNLFCVINEI